MFAAAPRPNTCADPWPGPPAIRNITPRLTPTLGTTSTWSVTVPGTTPLRSSGTTTWLQTTPVPGSQDAFVLAAGPGSASRRALRASCAVWRSGALVGPALAPDCAGNSNNGNAATASADRNPQETTLCTTRADGSGFSGAPPAPHRVLSRPSWRGSATSRS